MKAVLLSIILFHLFSFNSFGQKVTYNDLIGARFKYTSEGGYRYTIYIDDSVNLKIFVDRISLLKYKLDTTNQVLRFTQKLNGSTNSWEKYEGEIKIINRDTLKIKFIELDKTTSTMTYIRIK